MSEEQAEHSNSSTPLQETHKLFFVFFDGREAYAVPPNAVVEVATTSPPTQVPFTPEWVDGVVSVRGEIVPILDLAKYFRLDSALPGRRNRLILFDLKGNSFAVWSDKIVGVESVDESTVEPPLGNLPEALHKCMTSQFRLKETLVYSLDLNKILEETRLRVNAYQS